ncbi:methylmalonic aciduria and homocystinuria type D homolog, mitochondrial-like isoform X1 [Asterias rubens]|uniref:methylmalonic aciduria and homocystinuria type D homolog, mitochondrial-like isoform X1 n=1 Tax=Asterias rubens TaxID=7604 RepID=UPI001455992A|nr:methylmalonic aciduria and homocystinuria type D homolog, mitochondrial-like isoform X1 [Asterias rubens]XP_033639417.1 methylmalonic aciduria and homocystinuria type D homolog, mitochondrial-like isoform X1 [Asterias rubens]
MAESTSVKVDVNKQGSESGDSPKPSARMAKLLSRTRLVSYLPGLKALQQRVASVSSSHVTLSYSGAEGRQAGEDYQFTVGSSSISDKDLGPLGPVNPRFPLPGNTGLNNTSYVPVARRVPDILTKSLPQDRHASILSQFVNTVAESQDDDITKQIEELRNHPEALECISQDCPENLRKEFLNLFPGISIESTDKFTVVTLCQRTRNNMTGWSNEVEEERNQLLETFIESAKEMCQVLTEAGYWADFIDPSSGQAYLGDSNPNTSLFETDERYRSLGFEIEDLGCCKCIRHFKWGTHTFVGSIFTNAPPDSSLITTILKDKL